MNLFALVIIVCNMQTMQCDSYVPALYKAKEDCTFAADEMRKDRMPGVVTVYCRNTTHPKRRH